VALVKQRVLLSFLVVVHAEVMNKLVVLVSDEVHRLAGTPEPGCHLSHSISGFWVNAAATGSTLEEWGT
jgi:hypothetical protein